MNRRIAPMRRRPSSSIDGTWVHTKSSGLLRTWSITTSKVSSTRRSIAGAGKAYIGSMETTSPPCAVSSALKLAGPSPQPRMRRRTSAADRANMA